jgi:hypothetical protein
VPTAAMQEPAPPRRPRSRHRCTVGRSRSRRLVATAPSVSQAAARAVRVSAAAWIAAEPDR